MMGTHVDVTGLDRNYAFAALLPYMIHPDDADKRERLEAWMLAKICAGAGIDFPRETLHRLVEAAEYGVGGDIAKATPGGCMAGDVLLSLLEMAAGEVADAGLDKAQYLVSQIYEAASDGQGGSFKAGRDTVRNHWRKFGTVAHLWAAYVILLREAEEDGVRYDFSQWLDGCELAAIAHSLQSQAEQSALPRNGGPTLPGSALDIVGAPIIAVTPPKLSASQIGAIASFTPRLRHN